MNDTKDDRWVLEISGLPDVAVVGVLEVVEGIPGAEAKKYPLEECVECGRSYKKVRRDQRFCSRKCANRFTVRAWRGKNSR